MNDLVPSRHPVPALALARRMLDGHFVRFLCVGTSNFLLSFGIFQLLLRLPWRFSFAVSLYQLVSYAAGVVWSFYWNRRFTFRAHGPLVGQGVRFVSLQAALAGASALAIGLAVDVLHLPTTPSWLIIMAVITVANFVGSKKWVFAPRPAWQERSRNQGEGAERR